MQHEAGPGEVTDRAVLGLAAQPSLKAAQDLVVLCRTESLDEAAHERVPPAADKHAWARSNVVDQLVPRSQHGKIMPLLRATGLGLHIRICRGGLTTPRSAGFEVGGLSLRGMVGRTDIDVRSLTARELLRLSADVVTELIRRDVLRSRNAPAGDLAEYLVAKAFHGELAAPSVKSWDVQARDRKLQVKCRLVDPDNRRYESFSPFRSWTFDACIFITLDCHTYDIIRAVEVPMAVVKAIAQETPWVNGHRVSVRQIAGPIEGTRDVTDVIRDALDDLG